MSPRYSSLIIPILFYAKFPTSTIMSGRNSNSLTDQIVRKAALENLREKRKKHKQEKNSSEPTQSSHNVEGELTEEDSELEKYLPPREPINRKRLKKKKDDSQEEEKPWPLDSKKLSK